MIRILQAFAAGATLAIVVGACGSSTSPSPSASAAPSTGVVASAGPSASPGSSASPTPEPSVDRHGAPELETLLPDEIGGTTLAKLSLNGEDFLALGGETGRGQVETLLGELGKTAVDLSVAEAHDPAGMLAFKAGLFRAAGADPVQLLDLWVASQQAATQNRIRVSGTTVGGRVLTVLTDPSAEVGGTTYAWADGDTIRLVLTDDRALLEEAIAAAG